MALLSRKLVELERDVDVNLISGWRGELGVAGLRMEKLGKVSKKTQQQPKPSTLILIIKKYMIIFFGAGDKTVELFQGNGIPRFTKKDGGADRF